MGEGYDVRGLGGVLDQEMREGGGVCASCNGGGHERAGNTFACVLCDVCVCVLMFDDADEREGSGRFSKIKRSFRAYS